MADRIRERTKKLTVCAMLCALGVVLMALGSLIEVLDLSTAALASLLCIYAVIELGGFYPWAIWLVTSALSLLLLPLKTPALFYGLFLGYYPILKEKLERLPRLPSLLLKLVTFHGALGILYLILRLFLPSALAEYGQKWLLPVLYGMLLVCFLLYDLALTRLISFYLFRLRARFRMHQ